MWNTWHGEPLATCMSSTLEAIDSISQTVRTRLTMCGSKRLVIASKNFLIAKTFCSLLAAVCEKYGSRNRWATPPSAAVASLSYLWHKYIKCTVGWHPTESSRIIRVHRYHRMHDCTGYIRITGRTNLLMVFSAMYTPHTASKSSYLQSVPYHQKWTKLIGKHRKKHR